MALRRVDDLDQASIKGVKPVRFSLDGVDYEIDLSAKHAEALRKALGRYKKHARDLAKEAAAASANQLIREWARANGYDISDMGKIPSKIMEAFREANPDSPASKG